MSFREALAANSSQELRAITPPLILRACFALNGVFALFLESLYGSATDYARQYQKEESFPLAQRLFAHWRQRSIDLGPGDEYTVVDESSEMLGLRDWFGWRLESGDLGSGGI